MRTPRLCALLAVLSAACSPAARQPVAPAAAQPATEVAETKPAQPDMSDVVVERVHVAGNVHMLTGRGGNIGISVGDSGTLIIDDQFAPLAPKIRAAIDEVAQGPLKFVINTHWHGDHTGGNPIFGVEADIIAHDNVRKRLATTQQVRGRVVEPLPAEGLPVITFGESVTLHFNGEEVRVIHLPTGHTDGDSIVYFVSSNVVHVGDHMFNGRFPFVDLESGGTLAGYTANVARVLAMLAPNAKLIPGHGELATAADLEAFHSMLVETTASVREQKAAGKPLAEVTLDAKWQSWGEGFISTEKWIETLYNSL